jgi:hypothetical protein
LEQEELTMGLRHVRLVAPCSRSFPEELASSKDRHGGFLQSVSRQWLGDRSASCVRARLVAGEPGPDGLPAGTRHSDIHGCTRSWFHEWSSSWSLSFRDRVPGEAVTSSGCQEGMSTAEGAVGCGSSLEDRIVTWPGSCVVHGGPMGRLRFRCRAGLVEDDRHAHTCDCLLPRWS